jgi:hypothetical protein
MESMQPRARELTNAAFMFSRVGMLPCEVMPQQHREKALETVRCLARLLRGSRLEP